MPPPGWPRRCPGAVLVPLDEADHLRANGIGVRLDDTETIATRPRHKSAADAELLQAVQRATEEAMQLVRATLRCCDVAGDRALMLAGRAADLGSGCARSSSRTGSRTTSNWLCRSPPAGRREPTGTTWLGSGSGRRAIAPSWRRDEQTRVDGDMARTFCVGTPSDEAAEAHAACEAAITAAIAACRPGLTGRELHILVSDPSRDRGYPSQIRPGPELPNASEWVFNHGLGHGVGFHVHELPSAGTQGFGRARRGRLPDHRAGSLPPGRGRLPHRDPRDSTAGGCRNLNTIDYALVV